MPSILLINGNKIVSRLLQLSSEKHGYDLEIGESFNPSESSYNVVFVDSDQYSEELVANIKEKLKFDKLGYIGAKHSELPEGFDLLLEKPFLPTDFITLMDANFKVVDPMDLTEDEIEVEHKEEKVKDESFELDELDLDTSEQLEEFDDLEITSVSADEELNFDDDLDAIDNKPDDIDDGLVIPDAIGAAMTTGIAANVLSSGDSDAKELAGMVDDIDDMVIDEDDQKFLSDISSSLEEEVDIAEEELQEELSESIDDMEVPDFTELAHSEDEKNELNDLLESESKSLAKDVASDSIEKVVDNEPEESSFDISDAAVGAAVAATSAAVINEVVSSSESDSKEDKSDTSVEKEADDTLSQNSDSKVSTDAKIDISNLEKIIEAAVEKALTTQKLREALSGMDIGFTINPKTSDS